MKTKHTKKDKKIEAIAKQRLANMDKNTKLVSHKDMFKKLVS